MLAAAKSCSLRTRFDDGSSILPPKLDRIWCELGRGVPPSQCCFTSIFLYLTWVIRFYPGPVLRPNSSQKSRRFHLPAILGIPRRKSFSAKIIPHPAIVLALTQARCRHIRVPAVKSFASKYDRSCGVSEPRGMGYLGRP